ncbi:hypothetical protein OBBRIDRAFT_792103 [Obba rivulosa]|uniref:DUF6534 domain-containing protein n=1 Tax=Obba rivulosa TaxID=1052685 RepID=A0A8E2AW10_9APHY|nr:hypothetical protein OBBRIDRAFT_792103 [Obba rivulosa]
MFVDIDVTLGPAFLGCLLSTALFGVTSVQTWTYFKQDHRDPVVLRSLVAFLWFLDALHAALLIGAMYYYMVTNFGNVFTVLRLHWSIMMFIIVTGISDTVVRGIFAYRLWKLSDGIVLVPLIIGGLSLYHAGDSFYFAIKGFWLASWLDLRRYQWSIYAAFASEILADGMVTTSLYFFLQRFRSGVRFKSTDSTVHTLITYSINTSLLTSLCALLCLVTYAALPNTLIFLAFYAAIEKLYINALLANLNARYSLQGRLEQPMNGSGRPASIFGTISSFEAASNPLPPSVVPYRRGEEA